MVRSTRAVVLVEQDEGQVALIHYRMTNLERLKDSWDELQLPRIPRRLEDMPHHLYAFEPRKKPSKAKGADDADMADAGQLGGLGDQYFPDEEDAIQQVNL